MIADQPGPPGGHPNKPGHKPKNGCPAQEFAGFDAVIPCPNGGAFGTDTCIACCKCECEEDGTVEKAEPKCEFEGEEGTDREDLKTCDAYDDLFDYNDDGTGNCVATCEAACRVV